MILTHVSVSVRWVLGQPRDTTKDGLIAHDARLIMILKSRSSLDALRKTIITDGAVHRQVVSVTLETLSWGDSSTISSTSGNSTISNRPWNRGSVAGVQRVSWKRILSMRDLSAAWPGWVLERDRMRYRARRQRSEVIGRLRDS